jgi:hypothetical protein
MSHLSGNATNQDLAASLWLASRTFAKNQIYFFVAVPSTAVIQFVPSSDRSYFIV